MINEFQVRKEICEIGHRMWLRGFCAGNEGNISFRLSKDCVLCTPTMVSKGFMKPADLCKVDLTGKQLEGTKRRTSEILLHLEIYKARPDLQAIVHSHPPYLTAFAVARKEIPLCVLPEMEFVVGQVPIADYATPGTDDLARSILQFVDKANTVLLANHGAVCWAKTVEEAYFKMEVAESYCRMIMLAGQLGGATQLETDQMKELLQIKQKMGIDDPRMNLKNCDLCANDQLGRGVACSDTGRPQRDIPPDQLETLIQKITDQVLAAMKKP